MTASTPAARHKARHYAMQGLYQWQMSKLDPGKIARQFREEYDMTHVDVDYFEELLTTIPNRTDDLDQSFAPLLQDRSLEELDPITLALLRIASYELVSRIDVPYRVVINEAVGLAKKFGAADSHKFINGVMDKAAVKHRPLEIKGR
ncbi:transcription antitermination factor NusB [Gilvimarinus sp. F26214L]|uniref:transcription antitermination factor NusB n=1 Tax=Gilvimarinus sp. DZF01 TaxID=3461371 RepID=UPI004046272D